MRSGFRLHRPARLGGGATGLMDLVVVRNAETGVDDRISVQRLEGTSAGAGAPVTWAATGAAFMAHIWPHTHAAEYKRFTWLADPGDGMVALPYVNVGAVKIVMPFDLWDAFQSAVNAPQSECIPVPENVYIV